MSFEELGLIQPLLDAVRTEGYVTPTPIQVQAVPHLLKGRDLLGCAQTGTGKTAAFALPILQKLYDEHRRDHDPRPIRSLVITPTRELAAQIHESFRAYGKNVSLRCTVVFGGVRQGPQAQALRRGVDILVATPGRLLDLMGQHLVKLAHVEVFVLDEADRMLDMGFIDDIRRVIAHLPTRRQTMLFSATMPHKIQALADSILRDPVEVRIAPEAPAAETVDQTVYLVEPSRKEALLEHLLKDELQYTRALVFTRTKFGADRVCGRLRDAGVRAEAIHANKTQSARERALEDFKRGRCRVLVASDIAARGLDVDGVSHVINYDMPNEPELYIHRIGRTGRAGAAGKALSFCSVEERHILDEVERLIHCPVPTVADHPFPSPLPRKAPQAPQPPMIGTRVRRPPRNLLRRRR